MRVRKSDRVLQLSDIHHLSSNPDNAHNSYMFMKKMYRTAAKLGDTLFKLRNKFKTYPAPNCLY